MDENQVKMRVYRGFLFTWKAAKCALGVQTTQEQDYRFWEVINQVASGELTLNYTAAEIAQAIPGMRPAMEEGWAEALNELTTTERDLARDIVAASNGFVHPPS
jgi:hypothetical protein